MIKATRYLLAILAVSACSSPAASSAFRIDRSDRAGDGLPYFVHGTLGAAAAPINDLRDVEAAMSLALPDIGRAIGVPADQLVARRVDHDELGMTHIRYAQRAHDLPVVGGDVIVHLAAVRTQASASRPRLAHEVNVGATYDLLTAARDAGCRRVVFGSSHTVYGSFTDAHREPFAEDAPWVCSGINMYAATKLAAEAYLESFASSGGPEYLALRLGNIYGPRTSPGQQRRNRLASARSG